MTRSEPIAGAAQLAGLRGRLLLHSGSNADGLGSWSFAAAEPSATLIARGHSLLLLDGNGRPSKRFTGDPLEAAESFLRDHGCDLAEARSAKPEAPTPRVAGILGYDLARIVEKLPGGPSLGHDVPDLWLGAYDAFARWAPDGTRDVVGEPAACAKLAARLDGHRPVALPPSIGALAGDDPGDHHMARIERVLDYITAGDVYQVCLARRLVARVSAPGDALALYAALAAASPAPYGGVFELDGATVISSSPERFLARVGTRIETRPIKGTRPASPGAEGELAASPKDAAEHLMIVDLERNDLGRVAQLGSVRVDDLGYTLPLPNLVHKVSRVSAELRPGVGYAELLRATFPGGSVTGAPKVRAMQIIDELEPARRGPYCGAFGYFGEGGQLDLAIAIRVGVLAGNELRIHVGGGIVADSSPALELAETEDKAAGWMAALATLT